jgi:hypothetical protein
MASTDNFMIYSQEEMKNNNSNLLTPPIDATSHLKEPAGGKQRKTSVTFDLPSTPNNEEDDEREGQEHQEELLSPCSATTTVTSPTIDIAAQIVPDTMLVALFDRSSEMRGLVRHNKIFFLSLQQHLDTKWSRFENTLYCDRSKMPDMEWIKRISKALENVPSYLEKFKELVGYLGETDEEEDDDEETTSASEYFLSVELYRIRNYPNRLSRDSYPQFFINCEQLMNDQALVEEFVNTLSNNDRKELSDDAWETKVYNQLKNWPNLLEQLQEIIAYEVEEEEK